MSVLPDTVVRVPNEKLPAAVYIRSDRPDTDAISVASEWLMAWTSENGGDPMVMTPARRNADYDPAVRDLTTRVRWETPQTLMSGSYWGGGAVLVLWPDLRTLRDLEDDHRVGAICVVPWLMDDVREWIEQRRPTELVAGRRDG